MGRILKGTPLNFGNPKQIVWVRTTAGDFPCTAETEINSSVVTVVVEDNGTAHAFCESAPKESYRRIVRNERGYPRILEEIRANVAVLYSVINAGVREFWVKTAKYDRKVWEDNGDRYIRLFGVFRGTGALDNGSASWVNNYFFPQDLTSVPPGLTYSQGQRIIGNPGVEEQGPNATAVGADEVYLYTVRATGPGQITGTLRGAVSLFGTEDGYGSLNPLIETGYPELGSDYGFIQDGPFIERTDDNADGFWTGEGGLYDVNFSLNAFVSIFEAHVSGPYAIIKKISAEYISGSKPSITMSGSSVSGRLLEGNVAVGIGLIFLGAILFFYSGSDYKFYRVFEISGSTIKANLISESSSASLLTVEGFLMSAIADEIAYGRHDAPDSMATYIGPSPSLPMNDDDWRSSIAQFIDPAIDLLDPCLARAIYQPDATLSSDLYTIALDQSINGQSLRERLQASSDPVKATLTTQAATSDEDSCALGPATESPVKVPSPGRGTIEGITYIP